MFQIDLIYSNNSINVSTTPLSSLAQIKYVHYLSLRRKPFPKVHSLHSLSKVSKSSTNRPSCLFALESRLTARDLVRCPVLFPRDCYCCETDLDSKWNSKATLYPRKTTKTTHTSVSSMSSSFELPYIVLNQCSTYDPDTTQKKTGLCSKSKQSKTAWIMLSK